MTVMIRNDHPGSATRGTPILLMVVHDSLQKRIRLRILEREGQQIPLKNTQRDGRITRVLHDLLPSTILLCEFAELRDYCGQQLHHDRRTDVRHDAQRKDGAVLKRTTAEDVKERGDVAARLVVNLGLEPLLETDGIDTRTCDRRANAHDDQQDQREKNTIPQLRNLERVLKAEIMTTRRPPVQSPPKLPHGFPARDKQSLSFQN